MKPFCVCSQNFWVTPKGWSLAAEANDSKIITRTFRRIADGEEIVLEAALKEGIWFVYPVR